MTMDLTILVVEDDESLSEALQDTLQLAGYHVQTAENGLQALRHLENEAVDLIISARYSHDSDDRLWHHPAGGGCDARWRRGLHGQAV